MGNNLDILVIEDNNIDAKVLINVLCRCGFSDEEPHLAQRLDAGLAALATGHFDLVLLDLELPDSSGLATLEAFRTAQPEVPVVVVTAHEDPDFGLASIRTGAQDYLIKGRLYQDLLERVVRYAVERAARERELHRARNRAEENGRALAEHRERLAALVREQTRELEHTHKQLEQFAFVASHDLIEPVRKIKSFAGLLEKDYADRLDEKGRRFLEIVISAGGRMGRLIEDLIAYARLEQREPFREVDLNQIVARVIAESRQEIEAGGAVIDSRPLPTVTGDPAMLRDLFAELLANALAFGAEDRALEIRIVSVPCEAGAEIQIIDNGIGFPNTKRLEIFEPFKRLHPRGNNAATGIGLALCHRILDLHDGSIEAFGEEGQGARFTVRLPARNR